MGEYLEIKSLKSELDMYKDFSKKQTEEINKIKLFIDENKNDNREFQAATKDLYDIQCMNFKNCLEVIKVCIVIIYL